MKSSLRTFLAAGLAGSMLAACVHVSDSENDVLEIEQNAITAERTCGGKHRVESVTEDGFTCKD